MADDTAQQLDAAVRQGDRQRLLMIEQRLRARRHWDAQEGRDVGEEVDDIAWLLARCRLLEAERDKARGAVLDEIDHAVSNGHHLASECQGVAPGEKVPAVRISHLRAALAHGVSVPETP